DHAIKSLPPKSVGLIKAVDCLAAEDIIAPINVPDFPNSAMDGIALKVADLKGSGPWRLPIQSVVAAGDAIEIKLEAGHACKIMTGAPLMPGADTVIKIEDVTVEDNQVLITQKPTEGDFVRPRGNDFTQGQILFRRGDRFRPADMGVMASVGMTEVKVIPRPRVALISTGPELVEPGEKLGYAQIYNSNSVTLASLLTYDRNPPSTQLRITSNEPETFRDIIGRAISEHDLVLTTGGVSMGDYDCIPEVAGELGGKVLFHKVKIKPGKPMLIVGFKNSWLVSLPGNPVSAAVGYYLYVRRIISQLRGLEYKSKTLRAELGTDLPISGNRFAVFGARLEMRDNRPIAYPSLRQGSGRLSSISGMDALIMVEGGKRIVPKGEVVRVEVL
ncbi:MAG: molybdopterin molybdotransferase MoeA, partial [FCB group bacterium]|nr:molybdopterin molybdotransferase MoeA [FCB group bacterium]